jgi:hypothetical protein
MAHHVRLVNIIPHSRSGESRQDSEPSISVDPSNPKVIVATAFTPNPGGGTLAPYYVSLDGGDTWTLTPVLPGNGFFGTDDITVGFDGSGKVLYPGYLRGDTVQLNVDRTGTPSTGPMTLLEGRGGVDQPFVAATTVRRGPDAGKDRVYVGNNDFGAVGGRTSTVDLSLDAAALVPGFKSVRVDVRATSGQDGPQVRPTVHRDGTVYATFFGWRAMAATITTDVVVVRDDDWGASATPFLALVDPGDGKPGIRVANGVTIVWSEYLGQQRQAGNLAIAVDTTRSSRVYLAWCDGQVGAGTYAMHLRRSNDRGKTWSSDLLTVPNATNVGLAVNDDGHVGLLYQQVTGTGAAQRWETHMRHSRDHGSSWHDLLLATVPAGSPAVTFDPYLGDYAMLIAREDDFYGIFCANNTPDLANFPHGVHYQRNANFATKTLLNLNGITPVPISIDPFFFHVHWHEGDEEEEEGERHGRAIEWLDLKGLRYERLEIRDLELGGGSPERERGEERGEHEEGSAHHRLHRARGVVRRLADAIAELEEEGPNGEGDE